MEIATKIYKSQLVQDILGTDQAILRKLVDPSWSVLDLGCGSDPPLLRVMNPKMYYGVDVFKPSIDALRQRCVSRQQLHYEFDVRNLNSVYFAENRFDVVVCVDVIEHLSKENGLKLIDNAKYWASKYVYISTPNGYLRQDPYDSNFFQEHLSGWTKEELEHLGFQRIWGGGGLKVLRKREMQPDAWSHISGSSLRYRPRFLWSVISGFSQMFFKRVPSWSYQIHAIHSKRV